MIVFSCYLFTNNRFITITSSIKQTDYSRNELDLAICSSLQTMFPEITSIMTGFVPEAFQVQKKTYTKGERISEDIHQLFNRLSISKEDIAEFLRFGAYVYIQSIYGIPVDSQNVVQKSFTFQYDNTTKTFKYFITNEDTPLILDKIIKLEWFKKEFGNSGIELGEWRI